MAIPRSPGRVLGVLVVSVATLALLSAMAAPADAVRLQGGTAKFTADPDTWTETRRQLTGFGRIIPGTGPAGQPTAQRILRTAVLRITGGRLSTNGSGRVLTTRGILGVWGTDFEDAIRPYLTFRSVRLHLTRRGGSITAIPDQSGARRTTLGRLKHGRAGRRGRRIRLANVEIAINARTARRFNAENVDMMGRPRIVWKAGMVLGTFDVNATI